jgi:glucose/arabinose dehydrogenase
LGIAIDPDFPQEPYIYLFHTYDGSPDSNRVSRFTIEGDLDDPNSDNLTIDAQSQLILIDDMPAENNSHNGGTLRFAPDKTLLVSHGDDQNRSQVQKLENLKGKILRINRDGTIPSDNPTFPSEPQNKRPEIFAFGLRNPFRFCVDPKTAKLFIGDVGQSSREEIDLGSASGGENFGWPRYEGSLDLIRK